MSRHGTLADRFLAKVEKGDGEGCWEWTGWLIMVEGKRERAYRVAWFLEHGGWPAPREAVVRLCENTRCVRASHLWLERKSD